MKAVVLFSGKMRSGKNFAADMFKEVSEFSTRQFSFAESLKQMAFDVFEPINKLNDYTYENYDTKKTDLTRALLNSLGTNLFHNTLGKNTYWAEEVVSKISEYKNAVNTICLITDLRYEHELEVIHKYCYDNDVPIYVVRINRTEKQKSHSKLLESHSAETSMDNFDAFSYTIENNTSLETFKKNINKMYHDIIDDIEELKKSSE